ADGRPLRPAQQVDHARLLGASPDGWFYAFDVALRGSLTAGRGPNPLPLGLSPVLPGWPGRDGWHMDRRKTNRPKPGVGNYQHYTVAVFASPPCGGRLRGGLLGDHLFLDEVLEDRGRGIRVELQLLGQGQDRTIVALRAVGQDDELGIGELGH